MAGRHEPMAFEVLAAPWLHCAGAVCRTALPESGITTIPQLIGLRFDRSTKLWFSILYIRAGAGRSDPGRAVLRFAGI